MFIAHFPAVNAPPTRHTARTYVLKFLLNWTSGPNALGWGYSRPVVQKREKHIDSLSRSLGQINALDFRFLISCQLEIFTFAWFQPIWLTRGTRIKIKIEPLFTQHVKATGTLACPKTPTDDNCSSFTRSFTLTCSSWTTPDCRKNKIITAHYKPNTHTHLTALQDLCFVFNR